MDGWSLILLKFAKNKISGDYLVTMDIGKGFHYSEHDFLVNVLNKLLSNFISWIKLLLTSQQSCVINWGNTTPYFNLEKGVHQGDPVSAYLFILALEVLFVFIKSNENIKGIEIFKYVFFIHCLCRWFYFLLKRHSISWRTYQ